MVFTKYLTNYEIANLSGANTKLDYLSMDGSKSPAQDIEIDSGCITSLRKAVHSIYYRSAIV